MFEPKELVEKGVCVSFGEARRIITVMSEDRIQKLIEEKQWGRKPRKSKTLWPKEEYETSA